MATIIKIRQAKADELQECAKKVYKSAKKLMEFVEEEILESEDMNERGGYLGGGGYGGYRDDDDDDEDEDDYGERRGVPGTGRYGRRRYRRY